jgi:hypothetical protein
LTRGKPLPKLEQFTQKPDELEFISKIPFDYKLLNVQKVIKLIVDNSEEKFLSSTRTYPVKYHPPGTNKVVDYSFKVSPSDDKEGGTKIDIWLD